MSRFLLISFVLPLVFSCDNFSDSDRFTKEIKVDLAINDKVVQLDNKNKIKIKYLTSTEPDTIVYESKDNVILMPKFDSTINYFQICYNQYKSELYNDFLTYELPTLLKEDVENWHVHIDTPPFTTKNMKPSKKIRYLMMVHTDPERVIGIWTQNE